MGEASFYQQSGAAIAQMRERLAALEMELAATYERWEILEARKG